MDLGPGTAPEGVAKLAIAAAHTLRMEYGRTDIIEGPDGTLKLAEFHFRCDFVQQQQSCRIDISGHLMDHLASKVS